MNQNLAAFNVYNSTYSKTCRIFPVLYVIIKATYKFNLLTHLQSKLSIWLYKGALAHNNRINISYWLFLFHPFCICIPSPSFILRGKRWELRRSERSESSADANLIDFILRQTAWLMITALCVNNSTEERSQDFTENATDYFRYIRASISSSCFIPSLRSLLISAANGDIKRSPVVKRLARNWIIPQSENVWKPRIHSQILTSRDLQASEIVMFLRTIDS